MFELIFIVGFVCCFFIIIIPVKMVLVIWEGRFLQRNNEKLIVLTKRLSLYFQYHHDTKEIRFGVHMQ